MVGFQGQPRGSANMRGDSRPLKLWVISALPITASHRVIIEKKVWTLQKIHTLGLPEEQSDLPASKNDLPSPHLSSTPCLRSKMPKAARVKKEALQPTEEEDLVMEETPTSHQPGVVDDDASMADPDANEDFAGGNDEEEEEAQRVKIVSFHWSSIPTRERMALINETASWF